MTGGIPAEQTVYVAAGTNSRRVFHTDIDCNRIVRAENVREVQRGHRPELRQCGWCSGEWAENQEGEQDHPSSELVEMTPEEAGLSPLRTDREVGGS